jgi:hypothetical protein
MQALPTQQAADLTGSPIAAFLVRYRICVYLALFLLALGVIMVDQCAIRASSSPAAPTSVASPRRDAKPVPSPQADRPLLLPDR